MPNLGMRSIVPPIDGDPLPHGLLGACVQVVRATSVHELNGTDSMATRCNLAHPWQDCPDPAGTWVNPAAKLIDRIEFTTFAPVTAYAQVECSTVGVSHQEAGQLALDQVAGGEQHVLEEWFLSQFLANSDNTVDLTPAAGAVHVVNGVGLLETWLGGNYGGRGLLHALVGVGTLLSQNRVVDFADFDSCPRTLAGNGLVLGAGYSANLGPVAPGDDPSPAPAGEAWLYITPPVRVRRDEVHIVPTAEWQGINTLVNDRRSLAETTFVPEVACAKAAAVRVTLSACC